MTDQTETLTTTQPEPTISETTSKLSNLKTSFSIWPPTNRTRDAVTTRLIETLTDKSVLSDRYGTVPLEDATALANTIEQEAFDSVHPDGGDTDDDGIEILQCYSKEITKRMLDAVKSRSGGVVKDEDESVVSGADVETKEGEA